MRHQRSTRISSNAFHWRSNTTSLSEHLASLIILSCYELARKASTRHLFGFLDRLVNFFR